MIKRLNWGCTLPQGWLAQCMRQDLDGMIGHLDENVPELIQNDDIYGHGRLNKNLRSKNLGAIAQDAAWEVQYLWWNSETQSNWLDGLLKTARLTENPAALKKAQFYLRRALAAQDSDGYLGIYADDLRYSFSSENGELWAQATLYRALLAEYEFTQNSAMLEAVQRGTAITMKAYSANSGLPFKTQTNYAGVCHGLCFTDVCYKLYQLTGKREYLDFARFLYDDYSAHSVSEPDIQAKHLADYSYRFKGHGVHTYEHLRALIVANMAADGQYQPLIDGYLHRLTYCLTPSGAPIGDEWIAERSASAEQTGYEYCSLLELMDSYSLLLETTGQWIWADRMEWLLYNAGLGARHPIYSQIAYCIKDNSYEMLGGLEEGSKESSQIHNPRYKYSAVHQDAAVCCVPNAGRILPSFLQSVYLHKNNGIAVGQFVASHGTIALDDNLVTLQQFTGYPENFEIRLLVNMTQKQPFPLYIRRPSWAAKMEVSAAHTKIVSSQDEWIVEIDELLTEINIRLYASVKLKNDLDGRKYLCYGPRVYALPIASQKLPGKVYPTGDCDWLYRPLEPAQRFLWKDGNPVFRPEEGTIEANFVHPETGEIQRLDMIPMSKSILRQVSFVPCNP